MNITSLLKLATAFVAFSISAHAAEVFSVTTVSTTYPVTTAVNFNAVDGAGNFTNSYNIYGGDPDIGNADGNQVITNFNGDSSAILPGDQGIVTSTDNSVDPPVTTITKRTTYFGPKVYAGVNRDQWQTQGTIMHSNGNGFRIRANSVSAAQLANNGGVPLNTKAIYMFDADTSSLSVAPDDSLIFNDTDTLTAKLSVPGSLGPNWTGSGTPGRASLATYRTMVKAKGPGDVTAQYYAGTLYSVDLSEDNLDELPETGSKVLNMSETGAAATWTLVPNIEVDSGNALGQTNLTVDTSDSATTVSGKFLTNITQVGFLLETDTNQMSGGYNFGVREFIANASPASELHPIEWSQDFTSLVNGTGTFLTYNQAPGEGSKLYDGSVLPENLLTGFDHAYKWASNGGGLTAAPVPSTITQENDQIVLDVKSQGTGGEVNIRMVGPGTDNARRVRPPSHEVTFEIDLIEWKAGQADLLLQTRGHDGYVRSVISPSGTVKYSTWMSNYEGSGNINNQNVVVASMRDTDGDYDGTTSPATGTLELPGSLLNDGQILTYIQSYDNSDDSISYYYSLTDKATGAVTDPQFITKLTAAEHSPDGSGFFSISTGNKWGEPNNQDAVWIQYKKWGTATDDTTGQLYAATLGINSVSLATSDDDRDGVTNRVDAFPNNPLESVDSDSDDVGDNSDAHPGYDDAAVAAINTAAQSAGDSTFSYYVTGNADDYSYSVGGGAITQEDYDAAVAAQTTAETALANAREARTGSTVIDVANDVATITLTVEQTSDVSDWSSPTTTDHNIQLNAPAGASFYRFTIPE
jgi:hypothetical protein